jgi:photosystem II stability/assembly factor-like uncharacterized protein
MDQAGSGDRDPRLLAVAFVNAQMGWALGDLQEGGGEYTGTVLSTTDGGATWTPRTSGLPAFLADKRWSLNDVSFPTSGAGGKGWPSATGTTR